jgi:hypothetical protein
MLAGALICLALSGYYISTLDTNPFFGDESYWMGKSVGWFLLTEGRFDDPFWNVVAIDQPMLVPYVFGIVTQLSGYDRAKVNTIYDFSKDFATNRREGAIPDQTLLRRCRVLSSLCGVLGCAAAMAIAWRLAGPAAGLLVAILLGLNPHYIRSVQRAMSEGMLSLWLLVGWVLCAMFACSLSQRRPRTTLKLSVALGIAIGLGAMTKLTAAPMFAGVLCVGLFYTFQAYRAPARRTRAALQLPVTAAGLAVGVGFLVFVVQSPLTWRAPIDGTWRMLTWRQMIMKDKQHAQVREYAFASPADRAGAVSARLWHDIGSFAARGISRRVHIAWLDGWLFLGGLLWLLAAERKARVAQDALRHPDLLVAWIWLVSILLPLFLFLPVDWDRYYVPGLIVTAIVQSVALGALCRYLWNKRTRLGSGRPSLQYGAA